MTVASMPSPSQPKPALPPLCWKHLVFYLFLHGVALSGLWFFSWPALGIMLFLYWLTGSLGICLGYHRLLSHRSLQVPKWLEYGFGLLGALAVQGGPIFWVASHRQHHAFTEDMQKDPYSSRRGFWWSHMLWVIFPQSEFFDQTSYQRFAPDLAKDRFYQFLNDHYLLLQLALAIPLYILGAQFGLGWSFVIYGVFVRIVLVSHVTWFINSATHLWGYRRFECDDNSRNLWWAALLAYGEGWHNNHHADPKCAKAGLTWWEIDATYWVIWLLEKVGLATRVHRKHSYQTAE